MFTLNIAFFPHFFQVLCFFFFFQAEDGIRDHCVTGVQTCALPILLKEEGQNPTGTFKARGLSAAISRAKELGVTSVALPSAGNAGSAAAAYAAGGGTGIVGMWKAFQELEALGWIGPRRPRMVVVQAAGCAPIVRAFQRGEA